MPRAGLDREAVVRLALDVVDAGGPTAFTDLTLAAVAGRAGVAVPSLYKHVEGLPGLRREVARRAVDDFTATLREAAHGTTGPAALRAMGAATRGYARRFPGRYQALQGGTWARDPDAVEVRDAGARAVAVLTDVVAAAGVPPEHLVDAVRTVRAALHGFVVLELDGGFGMPDDVDASFDYLLDRLVAAFAAPTTPGSQRS